MLNIAVLVSGGGTNLQALLDAEKSGVLQSGKITLVISSSPKAYALERARNAGVETVTLQKKPGEDPKAYGEKLLAALRAHRIDMAVLAGFMHILDACVVRAYAGRILNVHPSLIPAFCGAGFYGLRVHEAVLSRGVKTTGATVHIVNEIPDGGPILAQKAVPVLPGDTPQTLQRRVMEQAEWTLLPAETEKLAASLQKAGSREPEALLRENGYPGRGVAFGLTPDGKHAAIAYFIMGRSENSRNRVFVEKGDGIITEAFDAAKLTDPSLIIYAPVRALGDGRTVVTNGDQTDTIVEYLNAGKTFEQALRTRTFEPDAPNYTPRVSGLITVRDGRASYALSILKAEGGDPLCPLRFFYEYSAPKPGQGHLIHTYLSDGSPIPSFAGEPERIAIADTLDGFTQGVWRGLNEDNKVSLFTRFISLETGATETRIINKNHR